MVHALAYALDERPDLHRHLFQRGFLLTNDESVSVGAFPLYEGQWREQRVGRFRLFVHRDEPVHIHHAGTNEYFLLGHAYDPYRMESDEGRLLEQIANSGETYQEVVDSLTGIFLFGIVRDETLEVQLDASGMQYGCYSQGGDLVVVSSHMRMIGDLLDLPTDSYVQELIDYRWYPLMLGNYLPGDLTAHSDVKRIIPNTTVLLGGARPQITRFYPGRPLPMCSDPAEYDDAIRESARVLRNTMTLIAQKWTRPAISLTGGVDSNTTFAAANGVYDRFETFSYVSMPREQIDADAAGQISTAFDVRHTVYHVPVENSHWPDFDLYKAVLRHNDGEIGPLKDNDTRKKIHLMQECDVDVEVKSWISETVRAYAYKYFGRTRMPVPLRPRHYASLYKIFLLNRQLLHKTESHFQGYLTGTKLKEHLFNYDESDLFVWEMMHGGKCGLDIGVMRFCFDITIPYNNRRLLDQLLRVRLEDRISDRHHADIQRLLNPELANMGIRVVNANETKRRKRAINAYFWVNSHVPF